MTSALMTLCRAGYRTPALLASCDDPLKSRAACLGLSSRCHMLFNFSFLFPKLSWMWGSHEHKIKFDFSLVNLSRVHYSTSQKLQRRERRIFPFLTILNTSRVKSGMWLVLSKCRMFASSWGKVFFRSYPVVHLMRRIDIYLC